MTNLYKEVISIEITQENRAMMLGARTSGMLGNKAYQKVLTLDVNSLRILAGFAKVLADIKEQEGIK